MCTGIGGPVGLALLGASGALLRRGISIGTQKYFDGAVDCEQVGYDDAVCAASGTAEYLMTADSYSAQGLAQAAFVNGGIGAATGGIMSSQPPWLKFDYMKNFKWGIYHGSYLDIPQVLHRAGPVDSPYGSWYSVDAPFSISQVRQDKALVEYWEKGGEYRDVAMGYTWIHGGGQPAYSGTVAPQIDAETKIRYPGGGGQVFLPEQQIYKGLHEDVWSWRLAP